MLQHRAEKLPEGGAWIYELKLDGFRAEAVKSGGRVHPAVTLQHSVLPLQVMLAESCAVRT